jgi:hypothetical protein
MFFGVLILRFLIIFLYLWGDYIKILIFLEILRLILLSLIIFLLKLDIFSINFFFIILIFLVCESSMGFLLFIFYIRIESEVVKKLILVQL